MKTSSSRKKSVNYSRPNKAEKQRISRKFSAYFAYCDSENAAMQNDRLAKPYTLAGLLYYSGMSKEDFSKLLEGKASDIAQNALLRIESFIEENALNGKIPSNAAMNTIKSNLSVNDFCSSLTCAQSESSANVNVKEVHVTMDDLSQTYAK